MESFLQDETGLPCSSGRDLDPTSFDNDSSRCLVLWDSLSEDLEELWNLLGMISNSESKQSFVALFNAGRDKKTQRTLRQAILRGARGIFFDNDPPDTLSKGVHTILQGQYWISRELLNSTVVETRIAVSDSPVVPTTLTSREKEVLLMVASGSSNMEIAYELNISYHTVKAHLANIYKKIGVPNRLQASLWATKNL
jgi:DNA-binding CsgD family transcriptional regulator